MPRIEDATKPARKILPIIFVIDTSGSMAGPRIEAVNQAMHETIFIITEISKRYPPAKRKNRCTAVRKRRKLAP